MKFFTPVPCIIQFFFLPLHQETNDRIMIKTIYSTATAFILACAMIISCSSNDQNDNAPQTEEQQTAVTAEGQKPISLTGIVYQKGLNAGQTGAVDTFDCYGMLVPSFTPQMVKDAGFDYSDLLNVRIVNKMGNEVNIKNVPFVTGFNEVGVLENCFCDYNQLGVVYGFGQLHGNFLERICQPAGVGMGDTITITLAKAHGYEATWNIMKSVYQYNRSDYPLETDEEFANFREVTTTGMGKGVLYRSSNPLNPKDNATRFAYVDSLARHYGIQTEIDLADTPEKFVEYRQRTDFTSTYCPALVDSNKVVMLGLTADTFGDTFMKTLGTGLKFMLDNKPPYLLHCNEGKDRCGFVSLVLEALAGATYQDVADDYMKTLMNFYRIEKGSESYNLRQTLSIDRLVWLLENVKDVKDFSNVDWNGKDPKSVNLQKAAWQYVKDCGLSDAQVQQLQDILQGKQ